MFSGLTNQVSSWMSSAMGEQVPTSTEDGTTVLNPENKQDSNPTKHSKLDVLANVKNQIGEGDEPGKGKEPCEGKEPNAGKEPDEEKESGEGEESSEWEEPGEWDSSRSAEEAGETPASEKSIKGSSVEPKDDEDKSRTTGGSDVPGNSTEEKDGQFEAVSNKVLLEAKSFGNFLYSAVNKAGKTISEAGAIIKKTVEENSILSEFNKEQDAFLKNKAGNSSDAAVPPWVGCANEESVREECLSLSADRRNFVRSPPAGVDFHFDYGVSYPIAIATMEADPNLKKKRFELVPKTITEENFWRNYFYRVSLICQANKLCCMGQKDDQTTTDDDLTELGYELDFE